MRGKRIFQVISIFIFMTLFAASYLKSYSREALTIVTTIKPLTDMTSAVVGNRAEVRQIIPPSAEIHHFQLRPSDLKLLSRADLIIAIGGGLEPWLTRLEKSLGQKKKIRSLRFVDFLRSENYPALREGDPHIWLDLYADRLLVGRLIEELSLLDPEGAKYFREQGQKLMAELSSLDDRFYRELAHCHQKEIIIAGHEAFAYLASRYDLTLISLSGPHPEAQPGARRLKEIIRLIKDRKIEAVFYESSQPPAYARTIARETGVRLFSLSAGVNLTETQIREGKTFLDLMTDNLLTLKEALKCQ